MAFVDVRRYIEENFKAKVFMFVGERNCGKTYSTMHLINDIVDDGGDFIYMRRYLQKELMKSKDSIFNKVEDCHIHCKGNTYIWQNPESEEDNRKCGYAVALTSIPKGIEFDNVKIILFDEFSITDNSRYLPNEFDTFANFIETVIRRREDIIIIMLGNNKNFYNPYTVGWNINLGEHQKRWTSSNGMVKYFLVSATGKEAKREETIIGKLFSGTQYDAWASGEFTENSGINIEKKPGEARYWCTIKNEGWIFTAWVYGNKTWISTSKGENRAIYNMDKSNVKENEYVFFKQANQIQRIRISASKGQLYYESEKIKSAFQEIINLLLRY